MYKDAKEMTNTGRDVLRRSELMVRVDDDLEVKTKTREMSTIRFTKAYIWEHVKVEVR